VSEAEGLSRAAIELGGDGIQRSLVKLAQVGAPRMSRVPLNFGGGPGDRQAASTSF
jgi:hypothetical protein